MFSKSPHKSTIRVPWSQRLSLYIIFFHLFGNLRREALIEAPSRFVPIKRKLKKASGSRVQSVRFLKPNLSIRKPIHPLFKVLEVSKTLLIHVTTLYKPKKISCSRKEYLHLLLLSLIIYVQLHMYLWRLQVVKILKLPLESIIWIGYGTWALNGFNGISPV